MEFWLA